MAYCLRTNNRAADAHISRCEAREAGFLLRGQQMTNEVGRKEVRRNKECLHPWEAYQRALKEAQDCRGCFLRGMFSAVGRWMFCAIGRCAKHRSGFQAKT